MKSAIARFLRGLSYWLEGDPWNYDEFSHGYEEGIKRGREYERRHLGNDYRFLFNAVTNVDNCTVEIVEDWRYPINPPKNFFNP